MDPNPQLVVQQTLHKVSKVPVIVACILERRETVVWLNTVKMATSAPELVKTGTLGVTDWCYVTPLHFACMTHSESHTAWVPHK